MTIPCEEEKIFQTSKDDQDSLKIVVQQGEEFKNAKENVGLGDFLLSGIPPAPKGEQKVIVKMKIDADGLFKCVAVAEGVDGVQAEMTVDKDSVNMTV
eukprot:CAMPEP_0185568376 /NCGR_PEP_ID=MMETSP0434-20130131/1355_1 /TAXON_ID=626734 ORGANISM="Favella taraikaensis, Strain Fe Narragansett Bay" /NCGR_SAMPLE_ID=MMETSP0434 /ASSEMBLY_ACC=CAM_ASM_000379 /LENGTH=97 /DNA_ID=CAMNT_0028182877 /DNA_START=1268 /DNA_END=1561 /DNA_ORIENTATION=+